MENPEPSELSPVQGRMEHFLKCWPEFFNALLEGRKTFEVRKNDRGFKVGDTLDIHEFVPFDGGFTGRALTRKVTYILEGSGTTASQFGVQAGYVVMGLVPSVEPARPKSDSGSGVPKDSAPSPVTGIEEEKWEVIDDGLSGISRMVRINCNGNPIGGWCATGVPGVENLLFEYANAHNASLERILEKTKTK